MNQDTTKLIQEMEIDDRTEEVITLNNMATAAYANGDYDTAGDYFKQSLAIQKAIGDHSGECSALNNIAGIYDSKGEYDKALDESAGKLYLAFTNSLRCDLAELNRSAAAPKEQDLRSYLKENYEPKKAGGVK